jgi:lysophospholipase L1-like esterase
MPANFILASRMTKALLRKSNSMRLSQLESLPPVPGRVVFLGDTLAHHGVWNEWFPQLPTLNNGINATSVQDALDRLDRTIVSPMAVVVMAGYDDLTGMGRSREPDIIATQVRLLLDRLRDRFPAAAVLVTGVQPDRRRGYANAVRQLNTRLRNLALETGATYVDVSHALAGPDGTLRPEFSGRGLNGAGYKALAGALAPHLDALKEASS